MPIIWKDTKPLDQLDGWARKNLRRAAIFLTNETKKVLSVPAPRVRVKKGQTYTVLFRNQRTGRVYGEQRVAQANLYAATTAATIGAPPRKLSGRGRASMTYEMHPVQLRARVGTNVPYMGKHEGGKYRRIGGGLHPFLYPTFLQHQRKIVRMIMGLE